MADVFVSYARTSAKQARQMAEALKALGYSIWIDEQLPVHRNYSHVIEDELNQAKAVLVLWSAEAARSDWVMDEAERAREQHKLVQVSFGKTRLPMPFGQIQCANLAGWNGDTEAKGWRQIVSSIADLTGMAFSATPRAPHGLKAAPEFEEPLLAVLAFDNLSGDPEMAYFSDGVSEEILQTVARGAGIKVIARSSSFQFRGAEKAVRHVAAELGVTHLLDGSVRRSGSKVRVAAQLIECSGETALWSHRFDRDLSDVFALQDEIAGAVATALRMAFEPLAPVGPVDPASYETYLSALFRYDRDLTTAAVLDVLPLLEEVVRATPKFARAWALLARARGWVLRAFPTLCPETVTRASVTLAGDTALRLDPHCGMAHLALGFLLPNAAYFEREELLKKALSVAPDDPEVLASPTNLFSQLGRIREAAEYARRARDLDPLSFTAATWCVYLLEYQDRRRESRRLWPELTARWPNVDVVWAGALASASAQSEWDTFDELVAALARRGTISRRLQNLVNYGQALRKRDPDYASRLLGRARKALAATGWVDLQVLTSLHALGARDECFDLIDQASFSRMLDPDGPLEPAWTNAGVIFNLSSNREMMRDPRFLRLCTKLGLCDYWVKSGRWPDCAEEGVLPYDFQAECRRLAST